jgi:hypothetical protein
MVMKNDVATLSPTSVVRNMLLLVGICDCTLFNDRVSNSDYVK